MDSSRQLFITISQGSHDRYADDVISMTVDIHGSRARLVNVTVEGVAEHRKVFESLKNFDFSAAIKFIDMSLYQNSMQEPMNDDRSNPDVELRPMIKAKQPSRSSKPVAANEAPPDMATMYWKLGSAAKVAKHYGVSTRVANDWVRALRDSNILPNPWRR